MTVSYRSEYGKHFSDDWCICGQENVERYFFVVKPWSDVYDSTIHNVCKCPQCL